MRSEITSRKKWRNVDDRPLLEARSSREVDLIEEVARIVVMIRFPRTPGSDLCVFKVSLIALLTGFTTRSHLPDLMR